MNQNFSKSKILHESSKLGHFQWREEVKIWWYKFSGIKNYGGTNLGGGGGEFWTSQNVRFPTINIFVIFWTGRKIIRLPCKEVW